MSLIESLVEVVDGFPSFVVDGWVELAEEETFNWEIENGINKVTQACKGVKSQVELSRN